MPPALRSRQKSCIACAEGKRRCNRQTPQCSRCLNRGVQCQYVNKAVPANEPQIITNHTGSESLSFIFDYDETTLSSDALNPSLFESESSDSWLTISPTLLTLPTLRPFRSCPEVIVLDNWSMRELLRSIRSFPQMFAQHRRTPFIHARLYDSYLPDAIQDAFTASASYCTKTPETENMILRIVESKADRLMQRDLQLDSLQDLLAATQALMLFLIIQLFDGDIRQRSIAEQNLPTLSTWTMQLHVRIDELEPSTTWPEWIFVESIRRTVILSAIVGNFYSALKVGYCTEVPLMSMLPFTAAAELWDASSYASWLSESHRAESDIVVYGSFSNAWENGCVSGRLDPFQKLLLTPCLGERFKEALEQAH
ncbi:hypothetical protein N7495_006807 [Penicillium taxi]|uniref:uncharacterized protein n=1 Tax=Penicillium taxi TaxID=168475 RepID=UPI002544DEB8|nr:uncharacterized protein N7495_006807 [Penicillium taxi]KAJ5895116.1 hypothetical protein N7495_006807 [Penicillium taxi]